MRLFLLSLGVLQACASSVTFREQQYSVSSDDASRFASLMTDYRSAQQDLRALNMEELCMRGQEIGDDALRSAFIQDCRSRSATTTQAVSQRDQAIADKQQREQAERAEAERVKQQAEAQQAEIAKVKDVIAAGDFAAAAPRIAELEKQGADVAALRVALEAGKKGVVAKVIAQAEAALENGNYAQADAAIVKAAEMGQPAPPELLDRIRVAKAADCDQLRSKANSAARSLDASRTFADAVAAIHSADCDRTLQKQKKKIATASAARANKALRSKKAEAFDAELSLLRALSAEEEIERLQAKAASRR